jgi:dTDP-4-dehydrorhamnose reductase
MKLIIVGGTGLVATELIRQGLRSPEVSSLVALSRREVQPEVDKSNIRKFKSVVVHDYAQYSDATKAALAGADACIWYVISTLEDLTQPKGRSCG